MNDVYDIIDALRKQRHLSGRMLARLAGMPATTYTTIMTRRPAAIQKKHLVALANALEVEWYDLLNVSEDAYPDGGKIPSKLSAAEAERILLRFAKSHDMGLLPPPRLDQPGEDMEPACNVQYRKSILLMLDRLNTEGLLEAMHQVLTLTRKPEFRKEECKNDEEEAELMRQGLE